MEICNHGLDADKCQDCCPTCAGTEQIECGCAAGDGAFADLYPDGCPECGDRGYRRCGDCGGSGERGWAVNRSKDTEKDHGKKEGGARK